jgi:hypothetical protein
MSLKIYEKHQDRRQIRLRVNKQTFKTIIFANRNFEILNETRNQR